MRTCNLKLTSCGSKDDFSLFKEGTFGDYKKLADPNDVLVSHMLHDHDKLYLIENTFAKVPVNVEQYMLQGKIYGIEMGDTVLSVKLRGQDQLNILAEEIKIQMRNKISDPKTCSKNEKKNRKNFLDYTDTSVMKDCKQYQITHLKFGTCGSTMAVSGNSKTETSENYGNKIYSMFQGINITNPFSFSAPKPKGKDQASGEDQV